jgi:Family of unknown function (DUF5995)
MTMMITRTLRRLGWVLAGSAALILAWPSTPALAADPPFVGWASALPPIAWQFDANSADECVAGRISCVDKTIKEMEKRFDPLAAACTHSAVFALAYLRTTQTYRDTAETTGFYQDPAFVNHEDAAFAAMYFDAYDDWAAGRVSRVPPAWRVAFAAGKNRQVSGSGDLLLGMNAHVNRDLPFVLAKIGLVAADGSSRKPDHDKIDEMLNRVVEPLLAEESARFDPQMETVQTPYGVGYTGLMQTLVAWRESAWRQAEQLVMAPDEAARDEVAQSIERNAEANAKAIVAATAYLPPVTSTTTRDSYCAANGGGG